MCLWIAGYSLGDINEPACMLNVTEGYLQKLLQRIDSLADPLLNELSDREAFVFLNRALYADDGRSDEQVSSDASRFAKFEFLTNSGESFDRTKSFVMADEENLRFIFEDDSRGFASARVARKTFMSAVQGFLWWIAKESDMLPDH
jgi:hypothetical protein